MHCVGSAFPRVAQLMHSGKSLLIPEQGRQLSRQFVQTAFLGEAWDWIVVVVGKVNCSGIKGL